MKQDKRTQGIPSRGTLSQQLIQRQLQREQKTLQLLKAKSQKTALELRTVEKRLRSAKLELLRLERGREKLRNELSRLQKDRSERESRLRSATRELEKVRASLEKMVRDLKLKNRELQAAEAALRNHQNRIGGFDAEISEKRKILESLKAEILSAESKLEDTKNKSRDLELTNLMSNLFLAADMEGLEKWLLVDAPVVLDYVRQVKDKSYFNFYKQYLYEKILKKGYRYYRCRSCRKKFHTESAEAKSCPYCSSNQLELINVVDEVIPEGPTGIPPLPTVTGES
jgi:DNA repair exonuclease SbcCD ATPase subunit